MGFISAFKGLMQQTAKAYFYTQTSVLL